MKVSVYLLILSAMLIACGTGEVPLNPKPEINQIHIVVSKPSVPPTEAHQSLVKSYRLLSEMSPE